LAVLVLAASALASSPAGAADPAARAVTPRAGAAVPPISTPGSVSRIELVETVTTDGWTYTTYRNRAYPCSITGYQTYTLAEKITTPTDAVRPLWVYMHGGGVGYFDPTTHQPEPAKKEKVEELPEDQRTSLSRGIHTLVRTDSHDYRMLAVSMCDHDYYGGTGFPDPNNPNKTPDGKTRTVNGLVATKAAIQYAVTHRPTDDFIIRGGSAGSGGSINVEWGLEQQGLPATGVIADSNMVNFAWQQAVVDDPVCGRGPVERVEVPKRLAPELIDPANDPAKRIADGRFKTPLLDIWTIGDPGQCGEATMACPLPDGSTPTMGHVDCEHEPVRAAIAAQGEDSKSLSMRLCVDNPNLAGACDQHVPTSSKLDKNTLAPWPADYNAPVMAWADARLDDDGSTAPSPRTASDSFVAAALTDFLGTLDERRADAGGVALAAGQSKAAYLGRLTTSDAWLTAVVNGLYQDTLGRPGDPGGVAYWVGQLRSGHRSVAQVAAAFYASAEYYGGLGGGTDASWITDLYQKVLHRVPDQGGLAYWVAQTAAQGRTSVAYRFYQSVESAHDRVAALYQKLLGRGPDAAGLAFWSAKVVTDGDLALAVNLAASTEYADHAVARFP
ncbi:MAG TPA: DUF4214 domain-containing protein, partial [Acidimicrobiales bacterium]